MSPMQPRQQKHCARRQLSHTLLITSLLAGGQWLHDMPVFAASAAPGAITNQATGSFVETSNNTSQTIESNIVQVAVTEVAGVTITPTNTPTATSGSVANFDFTVTNAGNDPTKFFLPSAPSTITGGTAGTLQVVGYIPAGGSQVTLATPINITTATDTGALSDPTLGGNTTLGSIPADAAIIVRVPVTVTATTGNPVSVTLGNTTGQPSANNTPYVQGANGTGSNDLYTFDNADNAVSGEASGSPANGDATGHRQEASATQTVNASAAVATVSVSGTVFHDYSANVVLDNDLGTDIGTNANSANLTVYAVNSSGMVVDKATVSATGVYTLSNVPQNSNVTLRLSDDASVAVGASAPTSPSLPSGWYNTGQNLNGTIVPTVGTTNATSIILGNIALSTTTTNITKRDFGIRQGYAVAADPEPTTCQVNFTSELTTGISSTGGQLTIGSKDLNWSSEWISGSSGANAYAIPRPVGPMPAVVTGNNQPGYWRNEPANARWISYPFRLSTNADGKHPDANLDGVQTGYWQYPDAVRLKFTAKVTVPANAITTNITLPLGVSVDNQFVSLKVNGVENLSPVPNPPSITAADYGSLINVNLNQGWQTGVNTIEIIMDSGPWAAGFFVGVNATSTSLCGKDYGDAPATYGSPSHFIATGLNIGSTAPDAETAPVAPLDGTGDGADETGLVLPTLSAGANTYQIPNIPVTNSTGSAAKLVGWIDFNNNGVFDSNEAATVNVPNSGAQTVTLNWSGLSGITAGNTYARFRLTSDATVATGVASTSSPTVAAFDGEVEDYAMTIAAPSGAISGTVFEDPNYGGGAGRPLSTPTTSGRNGATVELYKSDGTYVSNTTTSGGGQYTFSSVTPGDYFVRVVNSTVTSSRPGTGTILPVQTFRVDDSTGTPTDDVNRVGGEKPSVADTGAATTGAVLNTTNFTFTTGAGGAVQNAQAQSITPVRVGSSAITGIDFGYNFDTITNTNDSGQGSLRQFITNSNALTGESSLVQAGSRLSLMGGNEALPAGKESSIFMIPAASLTATNGVAVITPTTILPDITGTSTYVDATTQTVNIGNTNTTSTLGSSVTVGTGADGRAGTGDETTLSPLPAPEVQIVGQAAFGTGLNATANDFAVRGTSIYGFGSNGTVTSFHGQVVFRGVQDFQAELNAIGISATSTSAPAVVGANGIGTMPTVPNGPQSNLYIHNNLIANTGNAGIYISGQTSGAPMPSTESVSNAIIEKNVLLNNGSIVANTPDGMTIEWCGSGCKIAKNYIDNSFSFGIQLTRNTGLSIDDNTITASGRGNTNELSGIGSWSSTSLSVTDNILANNKGAGILASRHPNTNRGNNMTTRSTFSQNSMYGNGNLGIDLFGTADGTGSAFQNGASPYVTPNDGLKEAITARSNAGMDYPIITSSTLSGGVLTVKGFVGNNPAGSTTFANAMLEFFIADNDGNQNGAVISGDGKSIPHGEGKTFLPPDGGSCTTDANSKFTCTFSTAVALGLTAPTNITATATDSNGNTSEFGAVLLSYGLAGQVFEDVNYGGGSGRSLTASSGVVRSGARVELYNSSGNFVTFTTTDVGGNYNLANLAPGNYTVRVVNSSVTSSRTGYVAGLSPVQTFRTNGLTANVGNPDTDRVGGETPNLVDAGANTTNASLASLTTATTTPQSITSITVSDNTTGVDFGYNFDTIVNTNDSGQGSLRQFITNSNALSNAVLAQAGLTAGKETSIFMIPGQTGLAIGAPTTSGSPGLRAGLANQIVSSGGNKGAAVIALDSNFTISDADTSLDATTQTTNVGDTNSGTVGTGGTVGVDALQLHTIPKPEIVFDLRNVPTNTNAMIVKGANTLIKGFASYGYRTTNNLATTLKAAIVVKSDVTNANATTIQQLLGGTNADGTDPLVPTIDVGYTIQTEGAANISNNFFAYNSDAIEFDNFGPKVTFFDNEVAYNGPKNNNTSNASGIYADQMETNNGVSNLVIRGNLVRNSSKPGYTSAQGQGVQLSNASFVTVDNNTFTDNNVYGINASTSDTTITKNIVTGTKATGLGIGDGIVVYYGGTPLTGLRNKISQNSIYQNAKLGIDFAANAVVDPNDGVVSSSQANNGMDYPVITASTLASGTLTVTGFVGSNPAGSTTFANATLEFFIADNDGNQNGAVILGDGKSKPHGEGKTFLPPDGGSCTTDANSKFTCTFSTAGALGLTNANNITATATDSVGNTSEFSAVTSNAKVLLVKRITAINGLTTNPNDGTVLTNFVDDGTPANDDNNTNWPSGFLKGAINAGKVKPGDTIQYTIYFLNADLSGTNTVKICDRITGVQTLKTGTYGTGDLQLLKGGDTTYNLTSASDSGDRAALVTTATAPSSCRLDMVTGGASDTGTLVVDVTGPATTNQPNWSTVAGSAGQGTADAYGSITFTTTVNP